MSIEKIYFTEKVELGDKSSSLYVSGREIDFDRISETFHNDLHFQDHSWIAFGCDDNGPNALHDLYQKSSIHNSAVNIKSKLACGSGFDYEPLTEYFDQTENGLELIERSYSDSEKEQLIKQAKLFEKKINLSNYWKNACYNYMLYGGYFGLRFRSPNFRNETELNEILVEDGKDMRLGMERFRDNSSRKFKSKYAYLSDAFGCNYGMNKMVSYREWKPESRQVAYIPIDRLENKDGVSCRYVGNLTPYRKYYGTADYESKDVVNYILIDYMLSVNDKNEIKNGFTLDHIVVRHIDFDEMTDEQVDEQKKEDREFFKSNFGNYDGKKTLMTWAKPSTDNTGKPQIVKPFDIIPIPKNNNSERYNVLREDRLFKILNAHSIIAPAIIGAPPMGSAGFNSEAEFLITASKQLHWTSIAPAQQYMVENDLQELFLEAGIPVKPYVKASAINYRVLSDQIMQLTFGNNEIREIFGHAPMTEEAKQEILERTAKQINQQTRENALQ